MILTSVIIILREVLEAALLVSLLLALGYRLKLRTRWAVLALVLGAVGAFVFAESIGTISNWFEGTGQELVNSGLHFLIAILLLIIVHFWLAGRRTERLPALMALAVILAVIREGSEVWIYYSGFVAAPEQMPGPAIGGAIGLCTGISVGAILYYILVLIPAKQYRWASLALFALVAAGMSSQATNLLIQADYLPASDPLWDSSGLIPESSVPGQLLYALVGYEAQPVMSEVVIASLMLFSVAVLVMVHGNWPWVSGNSTGGRHASHQ